PGSHDAEGDPMRPSPRSALRRGWPTLAVFTLTVVSAAAVSVVAIGAAPAQAATSQFKGVNWADTRDNFVNGVLYVSGLSSTDTYSSANTVRSEVIGALYSIPGR